MRDYQRASKYISIACKSHMKYETSLKINFAKGLLEYEMKNYSTALKYFNKCKELQPTNYKVIHHIALILSKNSEFTEAEILFEKNLLQKENYFPSIFELFKIKILLIYFNLYIYISKYFHLNLVFISFNLNYNLSK